MGHLSKLNVPGERGRFTSGSLWARCGVLAGLISLAGPLAHAQAPARYPIQGQPHWEWLMPTPTGHTFWDAHLFTDSSLIAVGSHGTAVRTRDNGRHWQVLPLPPTISHDLTSVAFADSLNGWIAGHSTPTLLTHFRAGPGQVLRTTNGGRTWAVQSIGESRTTLNPRLAVVSATEAYVAYDYMPLTPPRYVIPPPQTRLRHTTNGGRTWTNVAWPDLPFVSYGVPLRAMQFFSSTTGILIGGDELAFSSYCLHTTDGGQTWQDIKPDPGLKVYNGHFTDSLHGWVVGRAPSGQPTCYRTADGGLTWQPVSTLPTTSNEFYDVVFADSLHGLIREANFSYWHLTADGGQTWTINHNLGAPIRYTSRVKLGPGGTGRGWWLSGFGALLRTADYGATWAPTYTMPAPLYTLGRVAFPEPTRGWAFSAGRGNNSTLRSTDRGRTWQQQDLPNLSTAVNWTQVGSLTDAAFPDRDTAWVVGTEMSAFPAGTGFVLGTTDGGQIWTRATLPAPPLRANHIGTWTGHRAAVAGADGALHLTRDGGRTWARATTGTTRPLYRPVWADSATLYVATDTALVLRSTDAGRTWQQLTTPFTFSEYGPQMTFTSALVGYYPEGSTIYRTADGGQTWNSTLLLAQSSYDFNGQRNAGLSTFSFRNARHGWAVGTNDIFETADAGQTWTKLAYVGGYGSTSAGYSPGTLVDRYNAFNSGSGITRYSEKFIQTDTSAAQPQAHCLGDTLTVAFDTLGFFSSAEQDFRVELSNKMGRFRPHETTILPLVGPATASPLRCVLPATLPPGTRYRLRVIRADSSVLGGDNERDLTLWPRPAAVAVLPADSARVCEGDSVQLTAPTGFAAYRWADGDTARTRWVKTAGTYAVQAAFGSTSSGACFGPLSAPVTVRLTPRPAAPVLTTSQMGTVLLTATPALPPPAVYAWTGPTGIVPNATGPTLLLTSAAQNGTYTATLTQRGCVSAPSAQATVLIVGLGEAATADGGLTLSPNPATHAVRVASAGAPLTGVALHELTGRLVARYPADGAALEVLLGRVPAGVYWLEARTRDGRTWRRRLLVAR